MSSEDSLSSITKTIPLLDSTNFNEWMVRIQIFLKHKNLLKYCLEEVNPTLSGAAEANHMSKRTETALILISRISSEAFDAVIDIDNAEDPYYIWKNILNRYASQSFNNKARIWLKFMRMEWSGDLKGFIQECRKMLNEVAMVKLGVPANVLCYSILAKLPKHMWTIVDTMVLNESLVSVPEATLSKLQEFVYAEESRKPEAKTEVTKIKEESASALYQQSNTRKFNRTRNTNYCGQGKHNPLSAHTEDKCWQLHPELKPVSRSTQSHSTEAELQPTFHTAAVINPSCLLTHSDVKLTVLDSGATHHMLNKKEFFENMTPVQLKVSTGNDKNNLDAQAIGTAIFINNQGNKIILEDALYVPLMNRNLISLVRLFKNSLNLKKIENNLVNINIDDKFVLQAQSKNNLLELTELPLTAMKFSKSSYLSESADENWHERLGHPHDTYLRKIFPQIQTKDCEVCTMSKMKHAPFKSHFQSVSSVLEAVHMDVVGPFSTLSMSGSSYFLTIVDQLSGYKTVKFLRHKSEVIEKVRNYKSEAENQTGKSIKMIISDGGGEFNNNDFTNFCSEFGISVE